MVARWKIERQDIEKVSAFYNQFKNNPFVRNRIERNTRTSRFEISKNVFFNTMVACLLTTQQRSGPDSAVTRFLNKKPFPLEYQTCISKTDLGEFIRTSISNFGGIRWSNKISKEVTANLDLLNAGLWDEIFTRIEELQIEKSVQKERETAEFIHSTFKGFGPKQSRNLLQSMGLTRYEIPIDSRVTKWLNDFGFPIKLTSNALSDQNYFNLISDGIQKLCEKCGIFPCVLDAAIFASYDRDKWTKENVIW